MANLVHEREHRIDEASDHCCGDTDIHLASRSRCDKDATSSHPTFTYANMPAVDGYFAARPDHANEEPIAKASHTGA
ncbi:hypothetical protein [Sorangium cellulosum]|uniref:hypothetical protein n=1 Tax=Sorangium cellulosum TaxID=56 RepID=UPI0005D2A3A7|nr:hypothetical protein [Sorangium cellulosum]